MKKQEPFKIINVIELADSSVIGMKSFPLIHNDGKEYAKIVNEAEKLFIEKAVLNGAKDKDIETYLKLGRFSRDGYAVEIVWS